MGLSPKEIRIRLFDRASRAAACTLAQARKDRYICPLRLEFRDFTELELEHVPPLSVGGKPLLLTCSGCNREGGRIDAHANNAERGLDFEHGTSKEFELVKLKVGSVEISADAKMVGNSMKVRFRSKDNHPESASVVHAAFSGFYKSQEIQPVHVEMIRRRRSPWLASVSWLRAAYLAAFAQYCYRYVCRMALDPVREQIDNPSEVLIPGFENKLDVEFIDQLESFGIRWGLCLAVSRTLGPAVCVKLGRHVLMLPFDSEQLDFYKRLAVAAKRDEGLQLNTINQTWSWPGRSRVKTPFELDFTPAGTASPSGLVWRDAN